jgi:hypothetical protein
VHEEVPAVHWLSFGLEYTAMFHEDGECRTEQKGAVGGYYNKPGYSGLRIVAGDVYRMWPKRNGA